MEIYPMAITVVPVMDHQFDLAPTEFRDALALRYQRPISRIPEKYDGYGAFFSLEHALDCEKGGLVTQRHNEIRDALGDIASMAFKEVVREPIVKEANIALNSPALVANLGVRGIWKTQTEALFDISVIDTMLDHMSQEVLNLYLNRQRGRRRSNMKQQ